MAQPPYLVETLEAEEVLNVDTLLTAQDLREIEDLMPETIAVAQDAKTRKAIVDWLRERQSKSQPMMVVITPVEWKALQEGKVL